MRWAVEVDLLERTHSLVPDDLARLGRCLTAQRDAADLHAAVNLTRVQPEVRSHEHGDDSADDDYGSRYPPSPATPLARVERVQAGRVMAIRRALTFVSSAPVPLSSVLETQISTLRERPSSRPNDRFLERSPPPLSWLATPRPGPNERRPESLTRQG